MAINFEPKIGQILERIYHRYRSRNLFAAQVLTGGNQREPLSLLITAARRLADNRPGMSF